MSPPTRDFPSSHHLGVEVPCPQCTAAQHPLFYINLVFVRLYCTLLLVAGATSCLFLHPEKWPEVTAQDTFVVEGWVRLQQVHPLSQILESIFF